MLDRVILLLRLSARSGLYPEARLGLLLLPMLLLSGCYGFVGDNSPPEWEPDPETVSQRLDAIAEAGSGPGADIFNARCAVCHQMNGQGIPKVYPPLVSSKLVTGDPRHPVRIVLHGFQGPIERNGVQYNSIMQPWKDELTDQEISDVLNYIRSSWGNSAPEIRLEQVRDIREATIKKVGAYSETELLKDG